MGKMKITPRRGEDKTLDKVVDFHIAFDDMDQSKMDNNTTKVVTDSTTL